MLSSIQLQCCGANSLQKTKNMGFKGEAKTPEQTAESLETTLNTYLNLLQEGSLSKDGAKANILGNFADSISGQNRTFNDALAKNLNTRKDEIIRE